MTRAPSKGPVKDRHIERTTISPPFFFQRGGGRARGMKGKWLVVRQIDKPREPMGYASPHSSSFFLLCFLLAVFSLLFSRHDRSGRVLIPTQPLSYHSLKSDCTSISPLRWVYRGLSLFFCKPLVVTLTFLPGQKGSLAPIC